MNLSLLVAAVAPSLLLACSGGADKSAAPAAGGRSGPSTNATMAKGVASNELPIRIANAAADKERASITKEQAAAIVLDLPEAKAWAKYMDAKTKGAVHAFTMVSPEVPEIIEGKQYWSVGFFEDRPGHAICWQWFRVRLDGKRILVESQESGDYLGLREWRAKEHPLARVQ